MNAEKTHENNFKMKLGKGDDMLENKTVYDTQEAFVSH